MKHQVEHLPHPVKGAVTPLSPRQLEIILAAGSILSERGVSGLTTKNLALQMGFSESALYRHFTGKEQILVSMLAYVAQSLDEQYSQLEPGKLAPAVHFAKLFEAQFAYFSQNPAFVVAVFSDGLLEESEAINQGIEKIIRMKLNYLIPILKRGQASGTFRNDLSPEQVAQVVLGTVRLLMYRWRASHSSFDILEQGKHTIHTLLTLITKP